MFEKVSGYNKYEVIGKNPKFLKSGQHDEKFYKQMWETILSGRQWNGIIVNKNKKGWILFHGKKGPYWHLFLDQIWLIKL